MNNKRGTNLNFIICSAGRGTRLKEWGNGIPKPIQKIGSITLLEISLFSCAPIPGDNIIIIVQKNDFIRKTLETILFKKYPNVAITWLEITHYTNGQLETAFLAKEFINPILPVVIFNSDTYFEASDLNNKINDPSNWGIIPCAILKDPKKVQYSFVKLNQDGIATAVEEKKKISDYASAGYYYFKEPKTLFDYIEIYLKKNVNEYYVAPIYNDFIKKNYKIVISKIEFWGPLGTPADLKHEWGFTETLYKKWNNGPIAN